MYIGTKEASTLLNISQNRLSQLLLQKRVRGAYKSGGIWIIPLYGQLPEIIDGQRGKKGTWNRQRKQRKSIVHVNSQNIKHNSKHKDKPKPVIIVKGKEKGCVSYLEIPCASRIYYRSDKPLHSGAKVWIEVDCPNLISLQPKNNIMNHLA